MERLRASKSANYPEVSSSLVRIRWQRRTREIGVDGRVGNSDRAPQINAAETLLELQVGEFGVSVLTWGCGIEILDNRRGLLGRRLANGSRRGCKRQKRTSLS